MRNLVSIIFLSTLAFTISYGQEVQVPVEIVTNWNMPVKASTLPSYEEEDAIVIFDREYKEFHTTLSNNMLSVIPVESCHRRIKINSQEGFENFVDVYIPLLENALDEVIVVDIKGRTIKKNGEVHNVKSDFIKETTLPANAPFLYGYKGKVKQFVFQNIEIGDEIEYYYTVTYKYGYVMAQLNYNDNAIINPNYVTLESKSTIYTDKRFKFKSFSENTTKSFEKREQDGKTIYELKIQNPIVNNDELFDNDAYSKGVVYYRVSYYESKTPDTWEDYFKQLSSRTRVGRKEVMTDELTIAEVAGIVEKKATINEKVQSVFDYVNEPLEKDTSRLLKLLSLVYRADYYDAQQYVLLLKKMGISSNIVLLKDKSEGMINKENIYDQFDDIMIEYTSEDSKRHYIPIYKPHSRIDEIDYRFQNTTALVVNPSTFQTEFITISSQGISNVYSAKYTFNIATYLSHKSISNTIKEVECSGAYEQSDRYAFLREFKDTASKSFSRFERNKLLSNFNEVKFRKFTLQPLKMGALKWNTSFTHELSLGGSPNFISINMDDLMEENYNVGLIDKTKRTENIFYNFSFSKKITYEIITPLEYAIAENKFLTSNFKNAAGSFSSSYKMIEPNRVQVQYEFILFKETYTPSEWPMITELYDVAYRFQNQKIFGLKK